MGKGRHCGNINVAREERDKELYRKFRDTLKDILDRRGYVSTYEAIEVARNSECSCFFVGYDRAFSILYGIEKHNYWRYSKQCPRRPANPLRNMKGITRTMFLDLYYIYENIRRENPDESRMCSVIKACDSPAKQFYLLYDTARKIISGIARKLNENIKSCSISEQ